MEKKKIDEEKRRKIIGITLVPMFSAILAICSWITIPIGPVPFTLQTFGVFVVVSLLGWKKASLSVLVWILLGVVGVPVFSSFQGGVGTILGATGGFILGFLLISVVGGLIYEKSNKKIYMMFIAFLVGLLLDYAAGTFWFVFVYGRGTSITFFDALSKCVLPFIIPDLVKMALAVVVVDATKKRMKKLNLVK